MILYLWESEHLGLGSEDLLSMLERSQRLKGREGKGVGRVSYAGRNWIIKYYRRNWVELLGDWIGRRHSRLQRAAYSCARMPRVVGSEGIYLIKGYGWIQLLNDLGDWPSLDDAVGQKGLAQSLDKVEQALLLMAEMHRLGIYHGDAKWGNFLLVDQKLYLVDTQQAGQSRLARYAGRDLGRFMMSAATAGASAQQCSGWLRDYQKHSNTKADVVAAAEAWATKYLSRRSDV